MRRPYREDSGPKRMSPETADRIGKLLLMLGSPHDGEALNAARKIEATLKGAGLDLHALASAATMRTDRDGYFVPEGPRYSAGASWNYANHFRGGRTLDEAAKHPDAPALAFGLPLYAPDVIESWREVGRHCLELNRTIPKKHGGRSLRDFEVKLLEELRSGSHWPTNRKAEWIETMVARCHQARDKAKEAAS